MLFKVTFGNYYLITVVAGILFKLADFVNLGGFVPIMLDDYVLF